MQHSFFDEGLATYLSGSGTFDYAWHKEKFKRFLKESPTFQIEEHTEDLYESQRNNPNDTETPLLNPEQTKQLRTELGWE